MADAEAMGRLISMALRSWIPFMEIHCQLRSISSDRGVVLGPTRGHVRARRALERWNRDEHGVQQPLIADAPGASEAAPVVVRSS